MCTYFSCWIFFFYRLHSFFYFCFSHAVKAQMFSNYPYAKWAWGGVRGSREQRQKIGLLVPTRLRLPFRLRLIFRLWKLWGLRRSGLLSATNWLCLKTPPIRTRPPAAAPFTADFVVSWRWLVDLRRWQLKGSGIKAEQKPSRRTIS